MISVCSVRLNELTEKELVLLVKYCLNCFEPLPVQDLVNRVNAGAARIYRFSGDANGVFVLSRGDGGLYVETVAGEKVVKNFEEIYKRIKITAGACGAQRLYSFISRPALEKLYQKLGVKPVATLYREDLL